ncbi:MAG: DUF3631 domain-containing protein [Acidothermus sp.]|nr:DUF3631 domain-containing protein [Acidothermus sp.]
MVSVWAAMRYGDHGDDEFSGFRDDEFLEPPPDYDEPVEEFPRNSRRAVVEDSRRAEVEEFPRNSVVGGKRKQNSDGVDSTPDSGEGDVDGAAILDDVESTIRRFVILPDEHAYVAVTLWAAHTWRIDLWDTTPRLAFSSPEPSSGKSRALEILTYLVPRALLTLDASAAYIVRRMADPGGPPTLLVDEYDAIFGTQRAAEAHEDLRAVINAGHRRGAVVGRCVVRGKTVATEELPAYGAVALAGLRGLPDTIASRSVIIRMRRRAPDEHVEPLRQRQANAVFGPLARRLAAWSRTWRIVEWPELPPSVVDRDADVWEPLVAVADLAGGRWPSRARAAAEVFVAARSTAQEPTLGVQLLADLRAIFDGHEQMSTELVLETLHNLPESPWRDLRGKPLDARRLARMLAGYDVHPTKIRVGAATARGYRREDLHDAWKRYLPQDRVPVVPDTAPEASGPTPALTCDVPDVPDVPDAAEHGGRGVSADNANPQPTPTVCARCGTRLDPTLADLGWSVHPTCGDPESFDEAAERRALSALADVINIDAPLVDDADLDGVPPSAVGPCVRCGSPTRRYGPGANPLCRSCRGGDRR